MKLVIVESPAKAKTINKYLGKDYEVLASYGHIRDLPSKNGSVEPENDFLLHYEYDKDSQKKFKPVIDAAKKADEVFLATDPDREGEAISWHVVEVLQDKVFKKKTVPFHRVVFNSITKKEVTSAIENPRELDMDLINAQQARRALDYLVGFTLSPVLWRKLPGSRSAGRVQSVALRLICEREAEIERFVSEEYWTVEADLSNKITARLTHLEGEKLDKFSINNEKLAKEVEKKIASQQVSVIKVEEKQASRNPKAPFITSTLQQEAARKLGFGAKKTMQVAQRLYEAGHITYMRTDGVYVAPEAVMATRSLIETKYGKNYVPNSPRMYQSKAKNSQEAHEAIRPTDVSKLPEVLHAKLEPDQAKLYQLVWKRMVASQMAAAIFDQVAIDFETADKYAILRANGSVVKFDGFRKLYEEGRDDGKEESEKILPKVAKGETADVKKVSPEQHFTEPPPRYSEASLVKNLEELGIGRPSTYASILSVLQERDYVVLDKKRFIPESRGRIVTAFLENFFKRYVEYDYTANLEDQLDDISEGKIEWKEVLREFWKHFNGKIDEAMELKISEVLDKLNENLEKFIFPNGRECPSCSDGVLGLKLGKFGGFIGCSNHPDCTYTKQISYAEDGEEPEPDERVLGQDPDSGKDVILKKGPYGWYVQLGEDLPKGEKGDKPKRFSLAKTEDLEAINVERAMKFLSLPRLVGEHPETKKPIEASIGRYGPYLKYNGAFVSIKGEDVLEIGINRAVDILASKKTFEPKNLGDYKGTDVEIKKGRFGPYISYGKLNVAIPKKIEIDNLDLTTAGELIEKKIAKDKAS